MNSKGNSFSNGPGASACNGNGASPASRIITGERLGGEHWWYLV